MGDARDNTGTRPQIWGFRDGRDYVAAMVDYLRDTDRHFSFRQLARFAGFGSPNYVQTYLRGERSLRADSAQALAEALGLGSREAEFFVALTALDNADDDAETRVAYAELLKLAARYGGTAPLGVAKLRYFTQWFVPVVHAMASLKRFQADPHWIAARIEPKIRPFDAKQALDALVELGILELHGDSVRLHEPRLETDPELQHLWIREYHRAMIRLSDAALDSWPAERRVTSAITITVPHDLVPEVLARVDAYREDLFRWLVGAQEGMRGVEGNVMQINFQAFPLTTLEDDS